MWSFVCAFINHEDIIKLQVQLLPPTNKPQRRTKSGNCVMWTMQMYTTLKKRLHLRGILCTTCSRNERIDRDGGFLGVISCIQKHFSWTSYV